MQLFIKHFRCLFLVFSQLVISTSLFSQNEATKWYFGSQAGLDFATNPPTILTNGAMVVQEGCASIADAAGNLMFYSDGNTIWDQTHTIMANGTGLNGALYSTQSCIIAKQPGNSNNYYIFTTGGLNGLCYSVVNMNLAAGNGSVTVKNSTLLATSYSDKVAGVKHCNGTDIWIVARDGTYWNNGNPPVNPNINFCAYQLTSSGLITTPVISPANNPWNNLNNWGYADYGCMKISPNGKKIGLATYNYGWNNINTISYSYELYDFNAMTGVISNSLGLNSWNNNLNYYNYSYGCEFSPDGTKFYGSSPWNNNGLNWMNPDILQWDLCAGSDSAIVASQYTVSMNANNWNNNGVATLQVAPNGKIYSAIWNQSALGVINSPNLPGAACNFVLAGQSISPRISRYGLPNFISSYIPATQSLTPFTYTINPAINCLTATFTPPPAGAFINCAAGNYNINNYTWIFGDPGSGVANTSTLSNPIHVYPTPGTYTASLAFNYACGSDTVKVPIVVIGASLTINTASITCATLGSATVNASGGVGPYSYTWMPTAQTTSVATGLNPGTYSLMVVDNGGNCAFTATTAFSSLVPFTGLVSNSPTIACNGVGSGTANVVLAGGSGTQYYYWTDGFITQTNDTAVGLGAGIHTLTVVDAVTSCSVIQFFMITQPPAQNPVITASSPTACAGTSISFTATNSGGTPGPGPGYTYTWTGGPTSDLYTVSQALAGNYIYTVNSSDSRNCISTQTILAGFIANPVLSVPNTSICPLQTGTLLASGATSYTWNGAGPFTNSFTASPAVNSQYTVIGSAAGCTSTPVTASIIINPLPSPTLTSNSPVCNGQALIFNGSGGTSYAWNGPQAFISAIQNPTINPAAPANGGVYSLTVTAANTCTATITTTVTVHPTPTVSTVGSTVCVNQTLSLTANSLAGAAYSWTGPSSFASTLQNLQLTPASTAMSGAYNLTVTSVQGCTNTALQNASVVAMPLPQIVSTSIALCSGQGLSFTGSGGNSYNWSGPNGFSGNQAVVSIPFVSINSAGTYTLLVTTGPCTITATKSITVFPLPVPTASSLPTCENASLQLNANGGAGNQNQYAFSWSGPQGFTSFQQNPVISPLVANMAGNYNVTVTDLNTCQASVTIPVIVLFNPVVTATGATVCIGHPAALMANGAQNYAWVGPGYTSNSQQALISAANSLVPVLYTVIGTAANSCTASATAILETVGLPSPSLIVTPRACLNSTISLKGFGGGDYLWSGPYNFSSSQQNVMLPVSNIDYNGTYTLTVVNAAGCSSYTIAEVIVDPIPEGDLVNNIANNCVPFCADFSLKLRNSSPLVSTTWQVGGQSFNTNAFHYCIQQAGIYVVTGTFTNATGCSNVASFQVQAYPLPVANFAFDPQEPIEGLDQVRFTNTSSGLNLTKWSWYFMDNTGYKTYTQNTNYLFEKAGTYPVSMVVKNTWGCADTIVKVITIEPDFYIYVPNSFTPNSDDKNDVFQPKGSGVVKYSLVIYDRWGETVFHTTDFLKAWDGTFRGEECKTDVYVWKMSASDKNGKTKNLNGYVTLYR